MDCCTPSNNVGVSKSECPSCGNKGKNVQLITLKSLLKALALETIKPDNSYEFCSNSACTTVYFNGNHSQTFAEDDLKVPVYQKNPSMDVPVCYCFDWTRERLMKAAGTAQQPADQIKAHVQAGRCGCEVNNPQGACCLGNVNAFARDLNKG
ncbi:putative iron-sulfur cluster-binding metallochaperone [Cohnella nanjingensis]|uniref:(2Fe-2S)-binding protein n=1 Tax=Cohnella nanjingensis TaxID=1387779 RepID=A0A7X0RND7_9BACL|nr:(2Fe-2S)-binding protein [Cohnella nanjingensis]MBB6670707.1 (2Fe-2S)-binding protein [Cohnella nanjingensis]